MTICLSEKGFRIVALIRAVRSVGLIQPGGKIQLPHEKPATYIGPAGVEGSIQMHEFRLFDGMKVIMEVPVLTAAMQKPMASVSSRPGV